MKVICWILVGLALILACGPRTEAVTADAVADAVNAAQPLIVAAYERQAEAEVAAATSVEEGRARLDRLDREWKPVREAHQALREAHSAWAAEVEADARGASIGRVRAAYCVLRAVSASRVALPPWPGEACP